MKYIRAILSIVAAVYFFDLSLKAAGDLGSTTGSYLVGTTNGAFYAEDEGTRQICFRDADAAILLNALCSLPQCRAINVLPGDYSMKASLKLKSGLSLTGQPGSRLIQCCNGHLLLGSSVCHCQVTQLELAGNRASFAGAAVSLGDGSRSNTLADLYIHDFHGDGINLTGPNTQFNVIRHNRIENCLAAGIGHFYTAGNAVIEDNYINRTGSHGIIVSYGGSNCRILSNTVINAGCYLQKGDFAHGIAADGWGKVHGHGNLIFGNIIKNSAMAGIEVADFQDDCTIAQNRVFGTGLAHMGCEYGIYFGGVIAPGTNVVITENIVRNTVGPGIRIDSPGSGERGVTTGVVITGNDIRDCHDNGILINVAANVTVKDNICQDNGNPGFGCGINIRGRGRPSQNITIIGNRCFDDRNPPIQRYGVAVDDAAGVLVSGNILTPNKMGRLHKAKVTGLTVTNNH